MMTPQEAFLNWIMPYAIVGGGILGLATLAAISFVAVTSRDTKKRRD